MKMLLFNYDPTFEEWITVGGGVFILLLVAFLVTKYTKYGGGSNYGMTGKFDDDFDDYN
ncbi:hypothetical protein L3X39_13800 [Sabulilitoribacter multivorans]|uniref:Class IIb bacteriocin, lactobin A/cerein 7B family n=1 Tax=Flaviramulus multivorans TaxID=1304750 RepID=A0ABS9IME4_9FLAO|nr:hypothetical protein [Flaviramulus multivorans]MCF7561717.1 hypothetical protein [Flaviramulus multivorans]